MRKKRCYIAGALNAEHAIGYLQNVHKMIAFADKVSNIGYSVFIPALDMLWAIQCGDMTYDKVFDNSQPWLDVSDCVALVPHWEDSHGTHREIARAGGNNIPTHQDLHSLRGRLLEKPTIICIVGESGSGKTTAAKHIERYGYRQIESRTTRAPRHKGEIGHTFVTEEEFDNYRKEDMLAFTDFGGNRYCCLKQDVHERSIYVIDESGLTYFKKNFSKEYHIVSLRIIRDRQARIDSVGQERVGRDKDMFTMKRGDFDYCIYANTLEELYEEIDEFMTN